MTCPNPEQRRGFFFRLSGTVVVVMALLLPYRMRLLFARMLTFIKSGPGPAISLAAKRQARFWNMLVLGLVFYLGIGSAALAKLLGRLWPSGRKPTDTFWIERNSPDDFVRKVEEPF